MIIFFLSGEYNVYNGDKRAWEDFIDAFSV